MSMHDQGTTDAGAQQERLRREAEYHDHRFGEDTRASTDKFYAVTEASFAWYRQRLLENVSGLHVLEYGCGPGDIAFAAAQMGAIALGIDISPVAIDKARVHATEQRMHTTCSAAHAETTAFPNARIDK